MRPAVKVTRVAPMAQALPTQVPETTSKEDEMQVHFHLPEGTKMEPLDMSPVAEAIKVALAQKQETHIDVHVPAQAAPQIDVHVPPPQITFEPKIEMPPVTVTMPELEEEISVSERDQAGRAKKYRRTRKPKKE